MGCRKRGRSGSPLNVICIESRISRVRLREVHALKRGPTSGVTIAVGHLGVGDLRQLGMRGVDCQRRAQDELVGVASRVGARRKPVYGVVVKRDGLGHERGAEAALAFRLRPRALPVATPSGHRDRVSGGQIADQSRTLSRVQYSSKYNYFVDVPPPAAIKRQIITVHTKAY